MPEKFDPFEATIESIGAAYAAGTATCVELAGYYLDRIAKFDRNGPEINSIITISPTVLEDAAELDRTYAETGPVGPLHGVPVLVKDQVDVVGMPTTLGSVLLRDHYPDSDGVVVRKLEEAGALILAKTTLGELAGFDSEDPSTAWGVGQMKGTFVSHPDANALAGARIGIIREIIGLGSDPAAADFARSRTVFDTAIGELASAGAQIVDPLTIENLLPLLAERAFDSGKEAFESWMGRNADPPYRSHEDFVAEEQYRKAMWLRGGGRPSPWQATYEEYLAARDDLRTNMLVAMAEHELDAIVHITVEHTPTLITDGVNAPYVNMKGAPHINTFLYDVPSMTVPAGFTEDELPVGITFLGRPYSDQRIVSLAYAYEQATAHRVPPASTPA